MYALEHLECIRGVNLGHSALIMGKCPWSFNATKILSRETIYFETNRLSSKVS